MYVCITHKLQKFFMQLLNVGDLDFGTIKSRLGSMPTQMFSVEHMQNMFALKQMYIKHDLHCTHICYNLENIIANLLRHIVLQKQVMQLLFFSAGVNVFHSICFGYLSKERHVITCQNTAKHVITC